jgi:hypothetical protein
MRPKIFQGDDQKVEQAPPLKMIRFFFLIVIMLAMLIKFINFNISNSINASALGFFQIER